MNDKILITGATGNNGKELLKQLTAQGFEARAMVRAGTNTLELASLKGVEIVEGDFNASDSLERVLNGIDRAFLLTNSTEEAETQQLDFVRIAKQSGVRHIVKLSQFAAAPASPVRFLRYHAVVEQAIRDSGMSFTFLRPNLYMQGFFLMKDAIRSQGKFFAPIGDARVSVVDVRDIAAVAAKALTEPGHEGKIYNLTGPEALTHSEIAERLSQTIGKPVTFVDIPSKSLLSYVLELGMPRWQAEGLVEDYEHYHRGEASKVEGGVFDATHRQPRSFDQFANDYASAFSG